MMLVAKKNDLLMSRSPIATASRPSRIAQAAELQPKLSDLSKYRISCVLRPSHATFGKISDAVQYPSNAEEISLHWYDNSALFLAAKSARRRYAVSAPHCKLLAEFTIYRVNFRLSSSTS